MKLMARNVILTLFFLFQSCGSSTPEFTPLKKPVAISLSREEVEFKSNVTRFAYVADQFTQSVAVVDTVREEIVDTAEEDDFDFTPIPVGGEPSAIAADDSVSPHRVFVADQLNNRIMAYQIKDFAPDSDIVPYEPVSLGGTLIGSASRPLFKNSGSASSPTLTNIVVSSTDAKNESWKLEFKGDGKYEVTGTESGLQTKLATEGKDYTSDNGEISFFISAGGEESTDGDQFFFGTVVARPLELVSSPVDLLIKNDKMYILTKNTPSIIIFDLATLTIDSTTAIPDADAVPTKMVMNDNDLIYISNLNSNTFFEFNPDTLAVTGIPSGLSNPIKTIGSRGDQLFLIENADNQMSVWNLDTDSIEKTLNFDDEGSSFIVAAFHDVAFGLISNVSGNVDMVDLDTLKRFDTDLDEKTVFLSPEFFDVLPESNPQLISVNTVPGVTLNEDWLMTYEAIVPGMIDLTGTFTGDTVTVTGADFVAAGVKEGDLLTVPTKDKEFEIESIDSATSLTLTTTPTFSGTQSFEIRSNGTYILVGSISGVQQNRVAPGTTYTSDEGQISLKTSLSFDKPETRGDFFSFATADTIDPIIVGSQGVAVAGIYLARLSDGKPVAYILQQTTGQITIVDLFNYNVHKTL